MRYSLLFIVLVALPVSAQGNVSLYIHSGASVPMSPELFTDYWRPGLDVGAGVGVQIVPSLEAVVSVSYNRFGFDVVALLVDLGVPLSAVSISGGNVSTFSATGGFLYYPIRDGAVEISLGARAGVFTLSADDIVATGGGVIVSESVPSETAFGLAPSIGLVVNVARNLALFGEPQWAFIFNDGDNTQYISLNVGVRIRP